MRKLLVPAAITFSLLLCGIAATQAHEAARAPAAARVITFAAAATPYVSCDIRTARTRHGVRIEAVASSDAAFEARYDLVISQDNRGGASDIQQGGAFAARANELVTLSGAEIGGDGAPRGRASLRIFDAAGELCSADRQL